MSLPGADGSHAPRATAQRPSPAKQLGLFPFCVCADTLCVLIVGGGKPRARLSVAPSSSSPCPCPCGSRPLCPASQQLGLRPSPGTGGSCLQSLFSSRPPATIHQLTKSWSAEGDVGSLHKSLKLPRSGVPYLRHTKIRPAHAPF